MNWKKWFMDNSSINWSFLNFLFLQAMLVMLSLLTQVWYFEIMGEWMVPQDDLQLFSEAWLWMMYSAMAYAILNVLWWVFAHAIKLYEWWKK